MSRYAALVLGGLVLACCAPVAGADEKQTVSPAAKLARIIKFDGFEANAGMTLQEVFDKLGEDYGLTFDVNEAAFRAEMVEDVPAKTVVEKAIPKMVNVHLDTVLRKILAKIPSMSGTTYIIRRDVVEITTVAEVRREVWPADFEGPFLPLVHAGFQKRPLAEALKELAEGTGFNVVVDSRVGDKARTEVTADFANAPLDTAVGVLADMADLKPVLQDNLLYVTTRANAAKFQEEERQRQTTDPNGAARVGSGRGARSAGMGPKQ